MPFVKKNGSQGSLPPTDARNIFIGRTGELLFFMQNILKPADPTHNIISISGQGGVGKSTLLARFIDEARSPNFKDYCLTAMVDERQTTTVSIMEKVADQLGIAGKFEKALRQYKATLRKLQTEQETLQKPILRNLPDFAGATVEGVPIAGPLLREGVKVGTKHLLGRYHTDQIHMDAELLEDPLDDLTKAFVDELNRLAEMQIMLSIRRVRRLRVLLFFDTFEQLAVVAAPWLLDYFLEAEIKNNIVLVIAGRDPLAHSSPGSPKRWLPYHDSNTIYSIPLDGFTEEETHLYLAKRGITEPGHIAAIWQLSGGLPLYLGLLTSNPLGKIDPTADVVANFLRWIPEQEHLKQQVALNAALFSRSFNQDDLEAFAFLSEHERPTLYRWLIGQPFVRLQDGRYSYHDLARELFSRHLYQHSRKGYHATRRALADHYQRLLTEIQEEQGREAYRSPELLELMMALAYQLLLLPDEGSHIKAVEQILIVYKHAKTEQIGEVVRTLRGLSQEQPGNQANSRARQTAQYLLQYIGDNPKGQELVAAANYLLELIDREPPFSTELLARIYRGRGRGYMNLKQYQQAIADFDRAIELDPTDVITYINRGRLYFGLKKYEETIASLERALELDPENGTAYYYLGLVYRDLNEYQQAIAKFDRIVELNPNSPLAYHRRGSTFFLFEECQQAIADFDHALELDPDFVVANLDRGWAYLHLKEERRAIADFDRALELDPNSIRAYVYRGQAYSTAELDMSLRDYQRAIADFNCALELDPQSAFAYHCRGRTYLALGEYQQAIDDFNHVLELDPKYSWAYDGKGWAYLLLRDTKGAKSTYVAGWEQDLHVTSSQLDHRGLGITCGWMAEWSGMCEGRSDPEMAERLETVAAAVPEHYTAYLCRGVAKWLHGQSEESLSELEQAIAIRPKVEDAYFWKGMVYASLGRDSESIAAIEKALELELPPILLAPLRWFEQDRPEFCEKYAEPLLARNSI
jgi:tetratricopeptide (TPR) repeat protein